MSAVGPGYALHWTAIKAQPIVNQNILRELKITHLCSLLAYISWCRIESTRAIQTGQVQRLAGRGCSLSTVWSFLNAARMSKQGGHVFTTAEVTIQPAFARAEIYAPTV